MTHETLDGFVAVDRPGYLARVSYGEVESIWTVHGSERRDVVVRKPI